MSSNHLLIIILTFNQVPHTFGQLHLSKIQLLFNSSVPGTAVAATAPALEVQWVLREGTRNTHPKCNVNTESCNGTWPQWGTHKVPAPDINNGEFPPDYARQKRCPFYSTNFILSLKNR